MDHRWDNQVRQQPAARGERERYGARPIADDPEVERRDRELDEERLRNGSGAPRGVRQLSPWEIGIAFHDQRDLYTRDSRVDASGYGRGPSAHPQDGSYAYRRDFGGPSRGPQTDASLDERQAWPWLNYHDREDDPFFHRAYEHGLWDRMKSRVSSALHIGKGPKNWTRSDEKIKEDVSDVLAFRGDVDASDIEVSVKDAEVTLAGTVPDRRTKRLAEETAEGIRGVRDVHNRLTIRHDDPTDANTAFVLPVSLLGGT